MNPDTLTLADYQRRVQKNDKLSGNLAGLLEGADLGGWAATLVLQLKRELTGTIESEVARAAIREVLWHVAAIAARMNVPLQDAAAEGLEVHHG